MQKLSLSQLPAYCLCPYHPHACAPAHDAAHTLRSRTQGGLHIQVTCTSPMHSQMRNTSSSVPLAKHKGAVFECMFNITRKSRVEDITNRLSQPFLCLNCLNCFCCPCSLVHRMYLYRAMLKGAVLVWLSGSTKKLSFICGSSESPISATLLFANIYDARMSRVWQLLFPVPISYIGPKLPTHSRLWRVHKPQTHGIVLHAHPVLLRLEPLLFHQLLSQAPA